MPDTRISILMYHQVGRFAPMRRHRANYCDAGRFARQMALLKSTGCAVLDLDTALAALRGERPLPPRAVVLSFDDAYVNFIEHALPVLLRHGFPAVVYAISGWLGRRMRWSEPQPDRARPLLMDAAQLREVQAAGITIGSHSVTHARLAGLAPEVQHRELADSRAALQDRLGAAVDHLCYPFGSFDASAVEQAAAAGYVSATTCLRGTATPADHPLVLPRKAISFGDDLAGFAWKLFIKHAPKPPLGDWRRRMAAARPEVA